VMRSKSLLDNPPLYPQVISSLSTPIVHTCSLSHVWWTTVLWF